MANPYVFTRISRPLSEANLSKQPKSNHIQNTPCHLSLSDSLN